MAPVKVSLAMALFSTVCVVCVSAQVKILLRQQFNYYKYKLPLNVYYLGATDTIELFVQYEIVTYYTTNSVFINRSQTDCHTYSV